MSESLNVGIVGYGFATKTFHAPLVAGVPGLKLAAISSSDPAKVAADWPEVATETSPEALFARPDIDLVVIPTPNETHYPLASAALAAGKHVYCEWPLGNGLAEAEEIARLVSDAGLEGIIGLQARCAPPVAYLRDLIAAGEIGEVISSNMFGTGIQWG